MEKIDKKIHQIDAAGIPLGRLASSIAIILRGKNKATFNPAKDEGDFVEVKNCQAIKFTGKKLDQKEYKWHTTHPGGLRTKKVKDVFAKNPGEVLKTAVWGMLPKNKLRDQMIKRLKTVK
ncbi:MAG: 50S ribosomal protein L13 [Patescibacteria group bacterium]